MHWKPYEITVYQWLVIQHHMNDVLLGPIHLVLRNQYYYSQCIGKHTWLSCSIKNAQSWIRNVRTSGSSIEVTRPSHGSVLKGSGTERRRNKPVRNGSRTAQLHPVITDGLFKAATNAGVYQRHEGYFLLKCTYKSLRTELFHLEHAFFVNCCEQVHGIGSSPTMETFWRSETSTESYVDDRT